MSDTIYPISDEGLEKIKLTRVEHLAIVVPDEGAPYLVMDYSEYLFGLPEHAKNLYNERKRTKIK